MCGASLILAGCHSDMWVQPRAEIQGQNDFFADKMDSRQPVEGTVARGALVEKSAYSTGFEAGKLAKEIPFAQAMTDLKLKTYKEFLLRGQERFEIFCQHCHGQLGDGNGMIAQRGLTLKRPVASYHTDRLRKMSAGHFFNVITKGHGVMFPLATKVPVADRWAISAYVRALQRSQAPNATSANDASRFTDPQIVDGFSNGRARSSAPTNQPVISR
jgi:mono/diheme cytochrome c family protein